MNAMISIRVKITRFFSLFVLVIFPLTSCDTLKELSGLNKQSFDDSMVIDTPDIMLPPNFNETPSNLITNSYEDDRVYDELTDTNTNVKYNRDFVLPQVQNYIKPNTEIQSSKSPSDSLEKFRNLKTFTIGEWVYGQSVREFKGKNLYYLPPINKGYNFSRRYTPNNYIQPTVDREQRYKEKNFSDLTKGSEQELLNIDQVPVLE